MRQCYIFLLVFLIGFFPSCEDDKTDTIVEKLEIIPSDAFSLEVGQSKKLSVTVYPVNETVPEWMSSDEGIAVVANDGTVTAIAKGTADITATAGGKVSNKVAVIVTDTKSPENINIIGTYQGQSVSSTETWSEAIYVQKDTETGQIYFYLGSMKEPLTPLFTPKSEGGYDFSGSLSVTYPFPGMVNYNGTIDNHTMVLDPGNGYVFTGTKKSDITDYAYGLISSHFGSTGIEGEQRIPAIVTIERESLNKVKIKVNDDILMANVEIDTEKERYNITGDGITGNCPGELYLEYSINNKKYIFDVYSAPTISTRKYNGILNIGGQTRETWVRAEFYVSGTLWLFIGNYDSVTLATYTQNGNSYTIEGEYNGIIFSGTIDETGIMLSGGLSFESDRKDHAADVDGKVYDASLIRKFDISESGYSGEYVGTATITVKRKSINIIEMTIESLVFSEPLKYTTVIWTLYDEDIRFSEDHISGFINENSSSAAFRFDINFSYNENEYNCSPIR